MDKKQSEPFIQDNLSPDGEIKSGYATLARENSDGVYELGVLVQGVYCAACIYKIEKTLSSQKDVTWISSFKFLNKPFEFFMAWFR